MAGMEWHPPCFAGNTSSFRVLLSLLCYIAYRCGFLNSKQTKSAAEKKIQVQMFHGERSLSLAEKKSQWLGSATCQGWVEQVGLNLKGVTFETQSATTSYVKKRNNLMIEGHVGLNEKHLSRSHESHQISHRSTVVLNLVGHDEGWTCPTCFI